MSVKAIALTILVVSIGYVYSVNDPYPNCGKRLVKGVDKRIVGGKLSVQGSWPWQVALLYFGRQYCGATLINDQWIVSAAHCFKSLIKLAKPVTLNRYVYPSCLLRPNQIFPTGKECYVTGWGYTSWRGGYSAALMQVKVELVDRKVCVRSYGARINKSVLCAGFKEGGKDSCQGDSGGPLVCQKDGQYYLTGVVSLGDRCGVRHMYGVH